MERLTKKHWRNLDPWECCGQDDYCQRGCHDEGGCTKGCIVPKLYTRLAEYEDTGRTPEELDGLCRDMSDLRWAIGLKTYEDLRKMVQDGRLMVLPCPIGAHLWRITHPYRQPPKVTEYIVTNFRTAGKKHILQLEVRVPGVPGTNWMRCSDFFSTREEAEAALKGGVE